MKPLVLAFLLLVSCVSKEPDTECSVTCIGDGLAISAEQCSSEVLRYKSCSAPELVREPIAGELVVVLSVGEERETLVLSVSGDEFTVGGPPAATELGSSVEAISDGALLGVVQSFSASVSTCTTP